MKRLIVIPVMLLLVILFSCQKKDEAAEASMEIVDKPEPVAPIAMEVKELLDGALESFASGEIATGAESLLDAVLIVKPMEDYPEGFTEKINSAKEYIKSGDLGKGLEKISDASQLIKSVSSEAEEKVEAEEEVKSDEEMTPVPLAAIFKEKLLAAQDEFKKGNADSGIHFILDALLLLGPRSN
jgi:hypothetical protein